MNYKNVGIDVFNSQLKKKLSDRLDDFSYYMREKEDTVEGVRARTLKEWMKEYEVWSKSKK